MKKAPFEIVRKEIDASHYYWIDGEFVPGVTTILDQSGPVEYGLRNFWKQNTAYESDRILKETAEFGSMIHDAIERLLTGDELDLERDYPDMRAKKYIMSFHDWFHTFTEKGFDFSSIQAEQVIGSKKYKYAGTLDLACRKDGELWIIDFKTTSGIHRSHMRQLAAYREAYQEYFGEKVAHTAIVRVGTAHKVGYEFKEVDTPFQSFLNIYQTYLDDNDGVIPEPPVVDVYPAKLRILK